jgi:exodeoxyribonuclease VII large subunit
MEAPASEQVVSNVPEFTVSELSFALRREIETAFPRVRVRGEISQPSFPRSGHCYFRLKDENAVLDAVCWKATIPRLGIRVEEGLEVIATGRLTTYAGSSRYQIIVDRVELAGAGALLKLLEDRRRKLQAEGLFDAERKRPLPYLPEVVGVVTSPSGAVIRDILHRLADRFPRRVLVWPVAVQGDKAAGEVAAAINGFNQIGRAHV